MRRVANLTYSRVKRIPFRANVQCCLVLRHLYAKRMLEILQTPARVFNIDESWINDLSWNQRQWHRSSSSNSVSSKVVSPRLSLIVAIDNFGSIYYSLTQVATD